MNKTQIMIYGSYGYTGKLIVEQCLRQGLKPVLAGRNEQKLLEQAQTLQLEHRAFPIEDGGQCEAALQDCLVLVNCAGPFAHTWQAMVSACLSSRTHYLDITGEYQVIQGMSAWHEKALAAGVMLLPGAGFDVVPSDCLAFFLKNRMPDAIELTLAIAGSQNKGGTELGLSRGTARTMLEGLSEGSMIRHDGKIQAYQGPRGREFQFTPQKKRLCAAISWGDIASAWWSTRIPHIEVWMVFPKNLIRYGHYLNPFKRLLKWPPIMRYLQNKINHLPEGPSPAARQQSEALILGIARNPGGQEARALLTTINGYDVTAQAVVLILQKITAGQLTAGFQTPATAYGVELVLGIPGTRIEPV